MYGSEIIGRKRPFGNAANCRAAFCRTPWWEPGLTEGVGAATALPQREAQLNAEHRQGEQGEVRRPKLLRTQVPRVNTARSLPSDCTGSRSAGQKGSAGYLLCTAICAIG